MQRLRVILGLLAVATLVACAPAPDPAPPPKPDLSQIDRVLVLKGKRELHLVAQGHVLKTYPISLGFAPVGPKRRQGDGKTPEGVYTLDYRNPHSEYYRSLHVSYPNAQDRARARSMGVSPGGDIMIHGLPNGRGWIGVEHRRFDWTEGCIAVTNEEMAEIWALVKDGTTIEIRP